ncbi:MAG: protein kinase [Bacteroidetes bacterium]|nr:protein kinase [Bacteroidota bacterium]MBU1718126.1 protein kinase [Bacteroidota bacterium]
MKVKFETPDKFVLKDFPQRVSLRRGDVLGGYHVDRTLGDGTFGVVYKVFLDSTPYALKILKLWETVYQEKKEELANRFLGEFTVGQTQGKHLVRSHTFGTVDGNPFFIMDFYPAGDLRKRISSISKAEAETIGCEMLLGLKELHQNGVIHRDLKPENVILTETGKALLTDFGISAFVNHQIKRMTRPGLFGHVRETFGTYAYIAPEQLVDSKKFKSTTPRTDIWSWGVLMYELLSNGNYPWGFLNSESDLVEFMKNARTGQFASRDELFSFPPIWVKAIQKCLEPDYDKRFESADQILDFLGKRNNINNRQEITNATPILLHVMKGAETGKKYKLSGFRNSEGYAVIAIGRGEKNEITIEDFPTAHISRNHATIECNPSLRGWYIRDGQWDELQRRWKKSTNGTFLNSSRIGTNGQRLTGGDIVTIGDTTLKIESK